MEHDPRHLGDELAAHAHWVRRLAQSLVHDETTAEDLVQDTWVAALRRPPDDRRALKSWLARVVRTLAWKRQRRATLELDGSRTPRGDRGAADDTRWIETVASPASGEAADGAALVERLELHRVLAEELSSIREPLRTTLLERYFEGLSAAEIAARSGVPAPTVRWRLQQGLEELRARLDRRFGERNTWMSALAFALPVKEAATVGGVGIGGGLLMSTLVKLAFGAAALVAAVLIVRPFLRHDVELPSPPALASAPAPGTEQSEGDAHEVLAEPAPTSRTEVASAVSSTTNAKPAAATETLVVARFLDEQQRPIADAWLRRRPDPADASSDSRGECEPSAGDGRARLRLRGSSDEVELQLEGGARGFATEELAGTPAKDGSLDLGDTVLHPGGSVRGRVVDAAGHPIAKAIVVVAAESGDGPAADLELLRNRGPGFASASRRARSGSDGTFVVDGIALGGSRAWASVQDSRWSVSPPIDIRPGSAADEIVLTIDSRDSTDPELADLEGRVFDAEGEPLAAPRIQVRQETRAQSFVDEMVGASDGRFRVHPNARGARIGLDVRDENGRYMHAIRADLRAGAKGIEVRLLDPRTATLAVRDEHGPLADFRVRWIEHEGWPPSAPLDGAPPHADGRADVRLPAETCLLRIEAAGHRAATIGPLDARAAPALVAVSLASLARVRGRVIADGRGVPGASLLLCQQPELLWTMSNGYVTLVDKANAPRATSGEQGDFVLDLERDGRYAILADAPGYARTWFGPVLLSEATGLSDLEIPLGSGGVLEGDVLVPPGRSPAGVTVGINCGDGDPRVQTVDAGGHFRFEHVMPGNWELRQDLPNGSVGEESFQKRDGKRLPARIREDARIVEGETTRRDLDLREQTASALDIELRLDSSPARGWHVTILPRRSFGGWGASPAASIDSQGRARLQLGFSGECTLIARPPAEQPDALALRFDLELSSGSNRWSRDIRTGRLEGDVRDWDPKGKWVWYMRAEGVPDFGLSPDARGHFSLASVPAGKISIYRAPRGVCAREVDAQHELLLGAGETQSITLP